MMCRPCCTDGTKRAACLTRPTTWPAAMLRSRAEVRCAQKQGRGTLQCESSNQQHSQDVLRLHFLPRHFTHIRHIPSKPTYPR